MKKAEFLEAEKGERALGMFGSELVADSMDRRSQSAVERRGEQRFFGA